MGPEEFASLPFHLMETKILQLFCIMKIHMLFHYYQRFVFVVNAAKNLLSYFLPLQLFCYGSNLFLTDSGVSGNMNHWTIKHIIWSLFIIAHYNVADLCYYTCVCKSSAVSFDKIIWVLCCIQYKKSNYNGVFKNSFVYLKRLNIWWRWRKKSMEGSSFTCFPEKSGFAFHSNDGRVSIEGLIPLFAAPQREAACTGKIEEGSLWGGGCITLSKYEAVHCVASFFLEGSLALPD